MAFLTPPSDGKRFLRWSLDHPDRLEALLGILAGERNTDHVGALALEMVEAGFDDLLLVLCLQLRRPTGPDIRVPVLEELAESWDWDAAMELAKRLASEFPRLPRGGASEPA